MTKICEERLFNGVSKEQVVGLLESVDDTANTVNMLKRDAVSILKGMFERDPAIRKRLIECFPAETAIHPIDLEDVFGIKKSERLRWTKEGKLPVAGYTEFKKCGTRFEVPMYNRLFLETKLESLLPVWRAEHKAATATNRKAGAARATRTRKENELIVSSFDEKMGKRLEEWQKRDPVLGATFLLAYWTMWASRWAKKYSLSARRKTKVDYGVKSAEMYDIKRQAMEILSCSPYTKLFFYEPENPHKHKVTLCFKHYEHFQKEKERFGMSFKEYAGKFSDDIMECPICQVIHEDNFYSLYYLTVSAEGAEDRFSFHIPWALGKDFLPDKDSLEKVHHKEQEGIFRFGRPIYEDEKLLHSNARVKRFIGIAMEQFRQAMEMNRQDQERSLA